MIITGAGAAGKEALYGLLNEQKEQDILFFDENKNIQTIWFAGKAFPVIHTPDELKKHFETDQRFITCIGHPRLKKQVTDKIQKAGGILSSFISRSAILVDNVNVNEGCVIQPGCLISFNSVLSKGVSVHANTTIGHNVSVGEYTMIGPNCSIVGPSVIGKGCYIGAGATIINGVEIGNNVIVGAGETVKENLPSNSTFTS